MFCSLADIWRIRGRCRATHLCCTARAAAHQPLCLHTAPLALASVHSTSLNTVLFAKAAAKEDVAEQALLGAKLGLYLGLLGCLAMLLVGKPLLVLFYGSRFAGSFVPCLLVLLGCAALSFSGPLAGTLSGVRGYPPSVIWAQSLALLTNVGLNLWLLPRYGIVGAAMASTGAYTVSALCITTAFARHFGIPLKTLLIPVGPKQIWTRLRQR